MGGINAPSVSFSREPRGGAYAAIGKIYNRVSFIFAIPPEDKKNLHRIGRRGPSTQRLPHLRLETGGQGLLLGGGEGLGGGDDGVDLALLGLQHAGVRVDHLLIKWDRHKKACRTRLLVNRTYIA